MTKHDSSGHCPRCNEIMKTYPGINSVLRQWFENVQVKFPNFHVAEAGRGAKRQQLVFAQGLSKAKYGQSAHNFNCALDTFFMVKGQYSLDAKLYAQVAKYVPRTIEWYGAPDASFYERPHFEVADWRELAKHGQAVLVEDAAVKKAG